jgi:hypothetical protein
MNEMLLDSKEAREVNWYTWLRVGWLSSSEYRRRYYPDLQENAMQSGIVPCLSIFPRRH